MNEPSFLYRPQHLPWLKRLPWVIPILLIPAGFFIYFTETHNPVQLAAIVAFAIGLPLLLQALLHFSEKQMSQNASLEITSKGVLRWTLRGETKQFPLNQVKSIQGGADAVATQLVIEEKNGTKTTLLLPGYFPQKPRDEFYRLASQYGVQF